MGGLSSICVPLSKQKTGYVPSSEATVSVPIRGYLKIFGVRWRGENEKAVAETKAATAYHAFHDH
jgi:hypothetical protein